jgi:putative copper export protein
MTTRQFFSILLSSLVFLHPIAAPQWFGALLVFGALYSSAVMKQQHQTTRMIKKRGSDSELPLAR